MATRHIKRLQQQLQQTVEVTQQSEDTETDEQETPKAAPFNPFDLLTDDEVRLLTKLQHFVVPNSP